MLESRIENKLVEQVELLGGLALKFISLGVSGVPDRIVLLPGGRIIFVETKAPDKKLRKLQEYRAKQLRELGFDIRAIDTLEKVKSFISEVKGFGV